MTGRKGRVVSDRHGNISYELRTAQDVPLEILNITEKQRFMDGEKRVAIISEAASSGMSGIIVSYIIYSVLRHWELYYMLYDIFHLSKYKYLLFHLHVMPKLDCSSYRLKN